LIAKSQVLRAAVSETFPYPTRWGGGPSPLAYFDVGAGPAVVMLHGLGANFTHWEHVAPAIARHHRVIGIDLLGCGDSAKPPGRYTIDLLVDGILRLLDELGVTSATWVGHSLGGMVATRAALRFPRRVERLVLISSAGFMRMPRAVRMAARTIVAPVLAKTLEHVANRLLQQVLFERNFYTRKFFAQIEDRDPHPCVDDIARFMCAVGPDAARVNFLGELERIVQPTLVLWGDRDRLLPIQPIFSTVRRMPAARLVVLHEVGHMPIIERPAAVVSEMLAFLHGATRRTDRSAIARAG